MTPHLQPKLAVLIDAENSCAAFADQVMDKIITLGRPIIRRAYGDWTTPQLNPWKKLLAARAIRPCQQFSHARGKNAADAALILDAMDLVHGKSVDGLCLVSSDSDFTGLAARAQEAGLLVYGFGVRRTMPAFVAACDEFVFVDAVESTDKGMRDEAGRDLAAELLESVRQMKAQQTHGVASRADQLQEKP